MRKRLTFVLIMITCSLFFITGCTNSSKGDDYQFDAPNSGDTVAEIVVKDFGSVFVKFFDKEAPKAVENFLTHAQDGYYDGLTFHRIMDDFMIQGGDPNGTGSGGESIWGQPFEDEFDENLHPYKGALCMANSGPNTNGSQFFIVQSSETYDEKALGQMSFIYDLDINDTATKNYGEVGGTPWLHNAHTVFGQVYDGLDIVDKIAAVPLVDPTRGTPQEEVIIETIKVFEYK